MVPRGEAGSSVPHSDRKRYGCLHQYYHHVSHVHFWGAFLKNIHT